MSKVNQNIWCSIKVCCLIQKHYLCYNHCVVFAALTGHNKGATTQHSHLLLSSSCLSEATYTCMADLYIQNI